MKKEKIQTSDNKTLKLANVLIKDVNLKEGEALDKVVLQMDNYLKNKGARPIGPLIQYTTCENDDTNNINVKVKLLRQSNVYLNNVDLPYKMESVIRVKNCMYARYIGDESKIKYAYDKINVTAFEEDIPLKGDSYTIFVNSDDDGIVADVFMERADNE